MLIKRRRAEATASTFDDDAVPSRHMPVFTTPVRRRQMLPAQNGSAILRQNQNIQTD